MVIKIYEDSARLDHNPLYPVYPSLKFVVMIVIPGHFIGTMPDFPVPSVKPYVGKEGHYHIHQERQILQFRHIQEYQRHPPFPHTLNNLTGVPFRCPKLHRCGNPLEKD
jgi:hypothetical protein